MQYFLFEMGYRDDDQATAERKEFCLRTSRRDMKHGSQVDTQVAIYNASKLQCTFEVLLGTLRYLWVL